jgi:DNA gyrase/topoisomerase IV subunit B
VIDEGRLFIMKIPLMSVEDKGRIYFYDMNEFKTYARTKQPRDVRYLKGLGSMMPKDWEYVMNNKQLMQIKNDEEAKKYMDMAFDPDSEPRKKWLRGEFEKKKRK